MNHQVESYSFEFEVYQFLFDIAPSRPTKFYTQNDIDRYLNRVKAEDSPFDRCLFEMDISR